METVDLKKSVLDYIDNADERLLKLIKALVETYQEDKKTDAVAYNIDGEPLTLKEYNQELLNAEAEIENGKYTAQEDLEKESENW
ncbi:hypothetical protein [Maribacter sp. ACAM166]|uniref:hypothetical protein n=1 Tax=Maribacter sp. ACAM166 TaxID=2508996 RepID=UPI0010FED832|nr:hypothetical protein [Maribacter sp. ACAM166]TLP81730.1 hypothetical protein ES765_03325 [Maribacter sp. ACAM166]